MTVSVTNAAPRLRANATRPSAPAKPTKPAACVVHTITKDDLAIANGPRDPLIYAGSNVNAVTYNCPPPERSKLAKAADAVGNAVGSVLMLPFYAVFL